MKNILHRIGIHDWSKWGELNAEERTSTRYFEEDIPFTANNFSGTPRTKIAKEDIKVLVNFQSRNCNLCNKYDELIK